MKRNNIELLKTKLKTIVELLKILFSRRDTKYIVLRINQVPTVGDTITIGDKVAVFKKRKNESKKR